MTFDHVMPLAPESDHVTLKASSMAPLHLLGQDDQNKVQHNLWYVGTSVRIM